ncbi:hypothetical protein Salat_1436400 [Sesamum alatum]|uniref:Uncharacterized protein n=1 Tax=Sesamum alatum TaxID=300844 RepID=A0AAE2CLL5_9LAMI|nr:hypothetical protein Salat_1436400 [Sesamum alatum]
MRKLQLAEPALYDIHTLADSSKPFLVISATIHCHGNDEPGVKRLFSMCAIRHAISFKVACFPGGSGLPSFLAESSSSSSSDVSAVVKCREEETFGGIEGPAGANSMESSRQRTRPMHTKQAMSNGSKTQAICKL